MALSIESVQLLDCAREIFCAMESGDFLSFIGLTLIHTNESEKSSNFIDLSALHRAEILNINK